jgi:hypothetical protein
LASHHGSPSRATCWRPRMILSESNRWVAQMAHSGVLWVRGWIIMLFRHIG